MSSSSDMSQDEFEIATKPVVARKKRNIFEIEPVVGESNLKGFVSAFQTIMDRTGSDAGVSGNELLAVAAAQDKVNKIAKIEKKKRDETVIKSHITEPILNDCELEIALKATAERGVIKLFRAVAMSRKRAIDIEASKGIGLTKNGQRRRVRQRVGGVVGTSATNGAPTSGSMSSFLDMLKKQKKANKPIEE